MSINQLNGLLALPGLVGKMYSKIQSCGRGSGTNHSRHKGHKDRSILCKL